MTNLIWKISLNITRWMNSVTRCIFLDDVFPLNITYVLVVKEIRDKWSNAGGDRYNDHMTCVCRPRCQRRPIASSGREKAARSRGQHLRQCSYQKQCSNLSAVYLARNLRPRANLAITQKNNKMFSTRRLFLHHICSFLEFYRKNRYQFKRLKNCKNLSRK